MAARLDSSVGRCRGSRASGNSVVLVGSNSVVVVHEAVDIPESSFEKRADEVGEATTPLAHGHKHVLYCLRMGKLKVTHKARKQKAVSVFLSAHLPIK
jgi:hypothetical protein